MCVRVSVCVCVCVCVCVRERERGRAPSTVGGRYGNVSVIDGAADE